MDESRPTIYRDAEEALAAARRRRRRWLWESGRAVIMTVYVGGNTRHAHRRLVEILDGVAGRTACPECGGGGDWSKFHPDPETLTEPLQCTDCKGTGLIYVSI